MTMYERLFKVDLEMLKVRADWNRAYQLFIDSVKNYEVKTKEDWEYYQKLRDQFIQNAWATIGEQSDQF